MRGGPRPPARAEAPAGGSSPVATNALLVILDAAGARHFGCYGYERATTPNLDRIATEAVLFEQAYTPAVFTTAALGSVWTGRPPDEAFGNLARKQRLPRRWTTLAERLTRAGVYTAAWVANARAGLAFGLDRGFAEFHEDFTNDVGDAATLARHVADWLEKRPPEPFFAYVHLREPHFPYDPPPPYDQKFGPILELPSDARREDYWIESVNARRSQAPTCQHV